MKANELMVGDWVLFSNELKRVTSISVSDDGVERIYVFGKTCQVSTINDYIQPIPLTPEILEKNGFKLIEPDFMTLSEDQVWNCKEDYGNWSIDLEYQEDENGGTHFAARIYYGYNQFNIWITWVHQLQHALKLCGIEKNIKL